MKEGCLLFRFEAKEIRKLADAISYEYDYVLITAGPEYKKVTVMIKDANGNVIEVKEKVIALFEVKAELYAKKDPADIGRGTGIEGIGCPVPPCKPTLFGEAKNCEEQLNDLIQTNINLNR